MKTLADCLREGNYEGRTFESPVPVCSEALFRYRIVELPADEMWIYVCPLDSQGNNGYEKVHLFRKQHLGDAVTLNCS